MNFKELMERAKNGNQAAVTELLMMYRPMLLKCRVNPRFCVNAILDANRAN